MSPFLSTHAPLRQARLDAARWWLAQSGGLAPAGPPPDWSALGAVPSWRLALQARAAAFPTLPQRLAAVAAALWHAPALHRCVDAGVLQRLAEDTGEAALARVLALDVPGPAQVLPAEGPALRPALRHMGRLILLAALPEPWRALSATAWGWKAEAEELRGLSADDAAGQRTFQRAGQVSATAWTLLADTDTDPAELPAPEPQR